MVNHWQMCKTEEGACFYRGEGLLEVAKKFFYLKTHIPKPLIKSECPIYVTSAACNINGSLSFKHFLHLFLRYQFLLVLLTAAPAQLHLFVLPYFPYLLIQEPHEAQSLDFFLYICFLDDPIDLKALNPLYMLTTATGYLSSHFSCKLQAHMSSCLFSSSSRISKLTRMNTSDFIPQICSSAFSISVKQILYASSSVVQAKTLGIPPRCLCFQSTKKFWQLCLYIQI